jgi:hypothetical protein
LPCLKWPASGLEPEPDESSSHPHTIFFKYIHVYKRLTLAILSLQAILASSYELYQNVAASNGRRRYLKSAFHSAVGIATGYGMDDREVGVRVPVGSRILTSPCRPDRLWGPPNLLYNGYGGSFPGVKRPRREADHSPPASAEIKKMWIYNPLPIRLHGVVLS